LQKKRNNKKIRLKYDKKKPDEDEIQKKEETIIANKKITIKRIRTNLERLKNHRGGEIKNHL
jgi:hypothetical protein